MRVFNTSPLNIVALCRLWLTTAADLSGEWNLPGPSQRHHYAGSLYYRRRETLRQLNESSSKASSKAMDSASPPAPMAIFGDFTAGHRQQTRRHRRYGRAIAKSPGQQTRSEPSTHKSNNFEQPSFTRLLGRHPAVCIFSRAIPFARGPLTRRCGQQRVARSQGGNPKPVPSTYEGVCPATHGH